MMAIVCFSHLMPMMMKMLYETSQLADGILCWKLLFFISFYAFNMYDFARNVW